MSHRELKPGHRFHHADGRILRVIKRGPIESVLELEGEKPERLTLHTAAVESWIELGSLTPLGRKGVKGA